MKQKIFFLIALLVSSTMVWAQITVEVDDNSTYSPTVIVNGDFETQPWMDYEKDGTIYTKNSASYPSDKTPITPIPNGVGGGWNTTESTIHYRGTLFEWSNSMGTYNPILNANGNNAGHGHFIEMNANNSAVFYQDLATCGNDVMRWTLQHAKRTTAGPPVQTMKVEIGAPNGQATGINANVNSNIKEETKAVYQYTGVTGSYGYGTIENNLSYLSLNRSDNWYTVTGVYTIPDGQSETRFAFIAMQEVQPNCGNLLDNITFSTLIGNLSAVHEADESVKLRGYWGEADSSKKLEVKIGSTVYEIDMTSVVGHNFVVTIPESSIGTAKSIEVYHQDYMAAKRSVTITDGYIWDEQTKTLTITAKRGLYYLHNYKDQCVNFIVNNGVAVSIPENTFRGNTNLQTVTLGNSVTSIGANAFEGCSSLYNVVLESTTPPILGTNVFDNCSYELVIKVPDTDAEIIYEAAENWSDYTPRITINTNLPGAGSVEFPYIIRSTEVWNDLAGYVNAGIDFSGKNFRQTADIEVTEMVGVFSTTLSNCQYFRGTYDGEGHTLNFTLTAPSQTCAPFRMVDGATIKNLHTTGTITTSYKFGAGLIGRVKKEATAPTNIINCRSSIIINSSISGDGTHAGFVGLTTDINLNGEYDGSIEPLNFEGCVFDGKILGSNTSHCGGFVGWSDKPSRINFTNCVFAPSQVTVKSSGSNTFARTRTYDGYITFTNSYYTQALGTAEGKQAYTITGGTNPTVTVENAGTPNTYDISGVTFYDEKDKGFILNNVLYAASGEELSLNLSGSIHGQYAASAGTISGTASPYTLTMGAANTVISQALIAPVITAPTAIADLVYNGVAQDLITAGSSENGTFEYSIDNTTWSATLPQGTAANDYTVYYRVNGNTGYSDIAATQIANVKIGQAEVTITWGVTILTYNGSAQAPTATASGMIGSDECTVTVTGAETAVGTGYTATAASLSNANYKLPATGLTVTYEIAPPLNIDFTVGQYWATWYGTYNYIVPTGTTAYRVTGISNGTVTVEEISHIPAGKGVLVKRADATAAETITSNVYTGSDDLSSTTSLLKNGTPTAYQDYILYHNEFVLSSVSGSVGEHRCYLPYQESSSTPRRSLSIGEETTSIHEELRMKYEESAGTWYDLNGRKLSGRPSAKGLYIHNGHQVVIK